MVYVRVINYWQNRAVTLVKAQRQSREVTGCRTCQADGTGNTKEHVCLIWSGAIRRPVWPEQGGERQFREWRALGVETRLEGARVDQGCLRSHHPNPGNR